MRKLITLLVMVFVGVSVWGQQWTGANIILTNPNNYPYGININTTYQKGWAREFSISRNSQGKFLSFGAYAIGDELIYGYIGGNTSNSTSYNNTWMTFKPNGNVGIGNTDPQAKLHVSGDILADEIRVEDIAATNMKLSGDIAANNITIKTNGQTADFVFGSDYQLKDLSEVETFIKTNKHLENIPSATEMEEQGVNLAEMNKLLLQKVEELTLHTIAQEKKLKAQENKLKEFDVLKSEMESIKSLLLNTNP